MQVVHTDSSTDEKAGIAIAVEKQRQEKADLETKRLARQRSRPKIHGSQPR